MRYKTTIEQQSVKKTYPHKFRIAAVNYPGPSEGGWWGKEFMTVMEFEMTNSALVKLQLERECINRYPTLFSSSDDAVPVTVNVTVDRKIVCKSYGLVFLQLLFTAPFTLPMTESHKAVFHVTASIDTDTAKNQRLPPAVFSRQDCWWASVFSPLGLIPLPGHSDRPRTSAVGNNGLQATKYTLEGLADALVQILQQQDMTPEAGKFVQPQKKF